MGFSFFLVFVTSVPIARVIGPKELGYYTFIYWLTSISTMVGSLGVAAATRKYMSEYIGRGNNGVARAIFVATLRLQIWFSLAATLFGIALVLSLVDPARRAYSLLLVAGMLPAMLASIPSMANLSSEDLSRNVAPGVIGGSIYAIVVLASLRWHWGLIGIATGLLLWKTTEFVLKMAVVKRWLPAASGGALDRQLRDKMFAYARRSVTLLLLSLVVFDRSEMFFLKHWSEISEVTFYALSFNLTEKVTLFPQVFAGSAGVSIMVEYGRAADRLQVMLLGAFRYLALLAFPLLIGAAAVSGPFIRTVYGEQYLKVIPVFTVAALLAIPKCFLSTGQEFLMATEHQAMLVRWMSICAALNLGLDALLIPQWSALGAAIANGVAQTVAVFAIWVWIVRHFSIRLPVGIIAKVAAAAVLMGIAAFFLGRELPPVAAIFVATSAGAALFMVLLRVFAVFDEVDRLRLLSLFASAGPWRSRLERALDLLIPSAVPPSRAVSSARGGNS